MTPEEEAAAQSEQGAVPFSELFPDLADSVAPTPASKPLIVAPVREGAGFAERFATGAGGAAQSVLRGGAKGVDNAFDAVTQLGGAAGNFLVERLPDGAERAVRNTLSPAAQALRKYGIVDDDGGTNLIEFERGLTQIPGFDDNADTAAEGLLEGVSQFVAGWMTAGRLGGAARIPTATGKLGKTVQAAGQGFVADFLSIDDERDRLLSNLTQNTALANPLSEYLAIDEDDDAVDRRFKAGLEGLGLGVLTEVLFRGVRAAKSGILAKKAETPEIRTEAEAKAEVHQREFDEAVEEVRAADEAEQEELFNEFVTSREADQAKAAEFDTLAKEQQGELFPNAVLAKAEEATPSPRLTREMGAERVARKEQAALRDVSEDTTQSVLKDYSARLGRLGEGQSVDDVLGEFNPARDLNFEKFDSPASLRVLAKSVSQATGDVTTRVSHEATRAQANRLGKTLGTSGDEITANIARLADSASDLPALLTFFRSAHQSSLDNLAKAAANPSAKPEDVLTALTQVTNIQQALKGATSTAGRALNILKAKVGPDEALSAKLVEVEDPRVLNVLDPTGTSTNAKDALDKLQRRVRAANGNPEVVAKVLRPSIFRKSVKVAESYYVASILSGPGTQLVNVMGGLSVNVLQPLERALSGVNLRDRTVIREGADQLIHTFLSSLDAMRIAARAWKQNSPVLDPGKASAASADLKNSGISAEALGVSEGALVPVLNGLDFFTQGVHRFILFGDEFNRQIAFQGRVKASALKEGRAQGLKGEDLTDFMDSRVLDAVDREGAAFTPQRLNALRAEQAVLAGRGDGAAADALGADIVKGEGAVQRGSEDFLETTRQSVFVDGFTPGGAAANFERFIRDIPGGRILALPFIRTPLNIMKFQLRRTPGLGRLLPDVQADLKGVNGPQAKAMAEARFQVGTAMYASGAALALSGVITGAGPSDPEQRRNMPPGWKPFAFKIGDEYITYSRGDPIAGPLGLIATAIEKHGELDEEHEMDLQSLAGVGFMSIVSGLKDKTYLKGISDLIGLFDNSDPARLRIRAQRFGGQKLGGFIPSLLANSNQDEFARVSNSVLDGIKARFPVISETLDPRMDLLGRPVARPGGFPNRLFGIAQTGTADDQVLNEIATLSVASETGITPTPRSYRTVKGAPSIPLVDIRSVVSGKTLHARYGELTSTLTDRRTGLTLHESLLGIINSPDYKLVGTDGLRGGFKGTRAEQVGSEITRYRKMAREQMLLEEPELQERFNIIAGTSAIAKEPGTQPRDDIGSDPDYLQLLETFGK